MAPNELNREVGYTKINFKDFFDLKIKDFTSYPNKVPFTISFINKINHF